MLYELEEIKKLRRKLGIGQKELAGLANVSQSLIAKIESKKIEPTYNKVRKIFDILT
jgi:predicted transcriptional regulator